MTDHHHNHSNAGRVLSVALAITVIVMAIEFVGAFVFNALALAADGAHLTADAISLAISVIAQRVAGRPSSASHTYGWRRAEVLAAEINAFLLLIASAVVIFEAADRFNSPSSVTAGGLITVAGVGLVANLTNSLFLLRSAHDNMNVRAAMLHTLGDAVASMAALIAGVVIALGGPDRTDAVAAIVISILIIWSAIRLLRDTIHVLLEAVPNHLDSVVVQTVLEEDSAVMTVHDLHLWTLAPGSVALSAHIELAGEVTLHQAQAEGARLKTLLAERFAVDHSTLELECHPCADDVPF